MIQKITLKNFKAFQNLSLPCKNLNILTGLNGMGKSSVIQTLLILRQSYFLNILNLPNPKLKLQGNLTDVGIFGEAIYGLYDRKEPFMSFKIGFDSDINCAWKTISDYVSTKGYIELEVLAEKTSDFNFQDALFSASKFHYIKAERLGPRDDFKIDETKTDEKDFGTDGRYAFQYYNRKKNSDLPITNLCHSKETSPLLKDQMAAWLSEISPNVNIHTEERDGLLYPAFSFGIRGQEHKPKNVGFGISYAFVVILALLTAEKGDLIIIENPEAHLHPKGQSKMTELMALAAQNGVQIFCETHSDHIFNASRLCAKKQMIEAEKIALYYFTKKQDYSEAILINMDKNGAIDKRPKGLFDEWGIILDQLID